MSTNLRSSLPVLVTICSMFVPMCNRFHIINANSGKITSFKGYPFLAPSFEENFLTQGHDTLSL